MTSPPSLLLSARPVRLLLRCSFDDLFCTVSSANMHLTRTDVRAAFAYLRTEHEIVVDRDSEHPGRDIITFLED